ncbi:hypothetical protein D9619_007530 [Psilocybe cf. subviscida]|uniref:Uncharacterized protein n=1 Tax=Psilocybe cf. subviscida TaxID=2480587 RepID=A0A8H5B3T3_9AGAR|nr:hypothetical protein D9619_007530 [Psilocybe cf. subviscida]
MSDFSSPSIENIVAATTSSNLNGFILEVFLCGLYCVVFAHAAWRLFHQRKWILVAFLTIQWMISIVVLALDWFATNLAYLRRGDTAFDTAQTLYYLGFYAGKVPVVEWAFVTIQILLCNGFLIWRCHVQSGKNIVLTIILSLVFVASIVLGFITAFPTKKMKDDTYGTLPASIYLAFVASSAGITLVMSSLLVRWTVRGKRLSVKSFLLALVDGAVPFSEVMIFLAFLAVVSLPSIYNSGHIRKLLVDEVTVYLQLPLPQLAGLTTAIISLREARKGLSSQDISEPAYSQMTFTRTILVPKGQE